MKIEKRNLNEALRVLGKVVCQTSPVELYRSVRFVGNAGGVTAMATDGIETVAGIGAGGYLAANSGAAGAAIGSLILPGIGTLAGSIIGILAGAAAGGSTGHIIGKLIDEDVIRNYRCNSCGYTWRADG